MSLISKALKRVTHDYMLWLTKINGPDVLIPVIHLRMKQVAQQLMMNEFELSYWHALNISNEKTWQKSPKEVLEQLLSNALFTKCHCNPPEEAQIFKTFIEHNYQMQFNLAPVQQKGAASDDHQSEWQAQLSNPKTQSLQSDSKLGLLAMKEIFDCLYYRRPKDNFKARPFTFVNLHRKQVVDPTTKFVDHPTDLQLDYNELVDDLEEEHLKRDVFTTEKPDQKE